MAKNDESFLSYLPYKLRKGKNVDTIFEYLLKHSKRYKIFSIIFLIVGIAEFIIFLLENVFTARAQLFTFHSIIIIFQMVLFLIMSYQNYEMSKKFNVNKEVIKKMINQ